MRNARIKTKRTVHRHTMRLVGMLLALTLLFGTSVQAFASANPASLNFDKKGSISLTLCSDEEESTARDGILTLYRVADLELDDGNMVYTLTEQFSASDVSLDDVSAPSLAETLAQYAAENGLAGMEAEITGDGTVSFADLRLGLYLIVQTTASTGYYAVDPFLVSVPLEQNGAWAYDVDAGPKVEALVEAETSSQPGKQVQEEKKQSDRPVSGNVTDVKPAGTALSKLPQTGQLNWPIPVMAALGALLFIAGSVRQRRKKKSRVYAA